MAVCRNCEQSIRKRGRTWTHETNSRRRCSKGNLVVELVDKTIYEAEPADEPTATLTQADVWVQMARSLERIADATEERNRLLDDWIEFKKDLEPLEFVPPEEPEG